MAWRCPECKLEFEDALQDHACGKIETIDQYIAAQPEEVRPTLNRIREVISAAAPGATVPTPRGADAPREREDESPRGR